MIGDWILVELAELGDAVRELIRQHGPVRWLVCFLPMLIFLEIPRYALPLFGLVAARRLGLPREPTAARRALLARNPLVSVIVAGRNEAESIRRCILSLLDQDYPNLEIIVVDDASQDDMYRLARPFAKQGKIRLVRNRSARGRGGRPAATNLGIRLARGELLVSLDADTTFDRTMVRRLVQRFADPRVGVVAGSVLPRRMGRLLERLQCIEYLLGIDLYKRWTALFGSTLQASGAIGAFRRAAVRDIGGWDAELAEDTDVSLRMIKAGWRVDFAHDAVARTAVPDSLAVLGRQRSRWDRGALRTFFLKHYRLLDPRVAGFWVTYELLVEGVFLILGTFCFPFFLIWMWLQGPLLFAFVLVVGVGAYTLLSLAVLVPIALVSENAPPIRRLFTAALVMPWYKEWLRWVRVRAFFEELLLIRVEDTFLPESAWANTPRF